jgi:hypothetical protein
MLASDKQKSDLDGVALPAAHERAPALLRATCDTCRRQSQTLSIDLISLLSGLWRWFTSSIIGTFLNFESYLLQFCSKNFSFMLLFLAMLMPQAYAAPPPVTKDEWILGQNHGDSGPLIVYIAPTAVKIVCLKRGFEILAAAPDWRVHSFRRQDKLMFTSNLSEFTSSAMVNPFGETALKDSHYKVVGTGSLKGLRYTKYAEGTKNNHIFWAADDISVDKHVCEFLCRYYYLEKIDKVPLYDHSAHSVAETFTPSRTKSDHPWFDSRNFSDYHSPQVGIKVRMSTTSWKKVPYNASDFALPTGFKTAQDSKQVLVSGSEKKQLEEMFDSIGFTSDLGRKTPGDGKSGTK